MSLGLGALLILASTAPARAQGCDPSPSEIEEARALFIAGSAAVESGRWSDAIESFERAYTLSCAASALYNLAMAHRALGRHRQARDAFDQLIQSHPDLGGEMRQNAETYRREEAERVAVLELLGIEPDLRPEISFDGQAVVDDGTRPITVETDAGTHSLVARIPDHQAFLWEGALADGQRQRVQVIFTPLPSGGDDFTLPIVLSVLAAALIGAGIGLGVYLQDDAQLSPLLPNRTHLVQ